MDSKEHFTVTLLIVLAGDVFPGRGADFDARLFLAEGAVDFHFAPVGEAAPEHPSIFQAMPRLVLFHPGLQPPLHSQVRTQLSIQQADKKALECGLPSFVFGKDQVQPTLKIERKVSEFAKSQYVAAQNNHRSLTSLPLSACTP